MNEIIEDSKVIGSAGTAIALEYAQVFNSIVTLLISVCTLIYVGHRAYQIICRGIRRDDNDYQ